MAQVRHGGFGFSGQPGAWTGGVYLFASIMMIIIGLFHVIVGLAGVLRSAFYVVTDSYAFGYDVTAWGWTHLILGILVAVTGVALLAGQVWARVVGVVILGLSALANFLFLPYQPVWSLLIIAADVIAIWALAVHGRAALQGDEEPAQRPGEGATQRPSEQP